MTQKQTDRNKEYMYSMWGTTKLATDYGALDEKKTLQEIMYDDMPKKSHLLKEQTEQHEKIRNDDDYDDWEYGTEPSYGKCQ